VLTLTRWADDEPAAREALGLALEDGDADVRAYARKALSVQPAERVGRARTVQKIE
jgi:hypothetical protein